MGTIPPVGSGASWLQGSEDNYYWVNGKTQELDKLSHSKNYSALADRIREIVAEVGRRFPTTNMEIEGIKHELVVYATLLVARCETKIEPREGVDIRDLEATRDQNISSSLSDVKNFLWMLSRL